MHFKQDYALNKKEGFLQYYNRFSSFGSCDLLGRAHPRGKHDPSLIISLDFNFKNIINYFIFL